MSPFGLMVGGGVLLLTSGLVLFLMVIRAIPPSLLLSLAAYAASVGGLSIGLFGAVQYVRHERRTD